MIRSQVLLTCAFFQVCWKWNWGHSGDSLLFFWRRKADSSGVGNGNGRNLIWEAANIFQRKCFNNFWKVFRLLSQKLNSVCDWISALLKSLPPHCEAVSSSEQGGVSLQGDNLQFKSLLFGFAFISGFFVNLKCTKIKNTLQAISLGNCENAGWESIFCCFLSLMK